MPLLRRDGRYFGTLCALDPEPAALRDDQLDVLSLLASLISFELEAAEEEQRREAVLAEARQAAIGRERLIGVLGHDLRTPVSAILGASSLILRAPSLPESAQRNIGRIVQSAERMGRMIGDVLDFTRGRLGGGIPIQVAPADLAEICRAVVEEACMAHQAREIRLAAGTALHGTWDEGRLAQAIGNLVDNALQYGAADGPVDVAAEATEDGVLVRVYNGGPPIPADVLPDLFDPFLRAGRSADSPSHRRGLGLGLYIVREVAQAHGGSVEVTSSADAGTTFWLRLPRHATRDGNQRSA